MYQVLNNYAVIKYIPGKTKVHKKQNMTNIPPPRPAGVNKIFSLELFFRIFFLWKLWTLFHAPAHLLRLIQTDAMCTIWQFSSSVRLGSNLCNSMTNPSQCHNAEVVFIVWASVLLKTAVRIARAPPRGRLTPPATLAQGKEECN